jgi:hypothetical protein
MAPRAMCAVHDCWSNWQPTPTRHQARRYSPSSSERGCSMHLPILPTKRKLWKPCRHLLSCRNGRRLWQRRPSPAWISTRWLLNSRNPGWGNCNHCWAAPSVEQNSKGDNANRDDRQAKRTDARKPPAMSCHSLVGKMPRFSNLHELTNYLRQG